MSSNWFVQSEHRSRTVRWATTLAATMVTGIVVPARSRGPLGVVLAFQRAGGAGVYFG